jgi:ABC-2 type transport system permease protein
MSAPISHGQVLAAKASAAVVTAAIQVAMWVGLLRLNNIIIHNPTLVIIFAVIIATAISVGTAVIALYFKDRERAQFLYSLTLVAVVGGSYFLNPSPFSLITRLAAGDPNIGLLQVALYAIPLIATGILFFNVSKRLIWARR